VHKIKVAYQSNEVGGAGIAEGVAEEDLDRLGGGAAGGHHHVQQHVRHYAPVQVQRHLQEQQISKLSLNQKQAPFFISSISIQ
jgi:hypothetical protein